MLSLRSVVAASALLGSSLIDLVQAKTVTYDWNITWVTANPDNAFERPVIGINGQWPIPLLNVTKGDRIVAHVHNLVSQASNRWRVAH